MPDRPPCVAGLPAHPDLHPLPITSQVVQCYIAFDIILLKGQPLYDRPLTERRRLLEEYITEVPGRLVIAPQQVGPREATRLSFGLHHTHFLP